ncbi:NUDIX hydrolase [Candidatus Roizmanbacteria bacterium]|nr:NUDIX hydrolase [Candidatus Roizmanbacteria bacterium]
MPPGPTKLKKWRLLKGEDISPSKWFSLEKRAYQLPNGKIIDDFLVTTIQDVGMVVAVTTDKLVVMVRQFKPGFGDMTIEFPTGRLESSSDDPKEKAIRELEEETGIKTDSLEYFATLAGFVTKGTEKVYCYFAKEVSFNSVQHLDETEEIEVLTLSPQEIEELIITNQISTAVTIAAWTVAKRKYSEFFAATSEVAERPN